MNTLNSIAEGIAFKLGEQFNDTLKEDIKNDFINYRSTFIRRDLERNQMSYLEFLQPICVEMELADGSYCEGLHSGCIVLKSKKPIAKPVRLKTNGRTSFHFVGTVTKSKSFVFTTQQEMCYNSFLPLQNNTIYYGYMNGHLVVYNNPHECKVLMEYIVADPRDINDCNFPDTFSDDLEILLPQDMITDITRIIHDSYRNPIKNGEQVNIDNNG